MMTELPELSITCGPDYILTKDAFLEYVEICKHENYKGKRIKRGLYKSQNGRVINADLNGALNILKKEIPNAFDGYGIEVCSTPVVLTIK